MTTIEPMIIAPAGNPIWNAARIIVAAVIVTSAPWAWMLYDERATSERLLAEKMASQMRVDAILVKYANGRSVAVNFKERTQ